MGSVGIKTMPESLAVDLGTPTKMHTFRSAHGKAQLHYGFPQNLRETLVVYCTLLPEKTYMGNDYSKTSSGSAEKRRSSLIAATDIKLRLTKPSVASRVDYCNKLYRGLRLKMIWKIKVVQSMAARLLTGVKSERAYYAYAKRSAPPSR